MSETIVAAILSLLSVIVVAVVGYRQAVRVGERQAQATTAQNAAAAQAALDQKRLELGSAVGELFHKDAQELRTQLAAQTARLFEAEQEHNDEVNALHAAARDQERQHGVEIHELERKHRDTLSECERRHSEAIRECEKHQHLLKTERDNAIERAALWEFEAGRLRGQILGTDVAFSRSPRPPGTPPGAPQPRLLLVDDEPDIRRLFQMMLAGHGYEMHVVSNGADALQQFLGSPEPFDLLILDHRMAGMDGKTVARRVREEEARRADGHTAPILFFTGEAIAFEGGVLDEFSPARCLSKPVLPDDFRAAVSAMLGTAPNS